MQSTANQPLRTTLSRADAESFLYREAALIDSWQLMEWAALFAADGEYLIPPLDEPEGEPGKSLFLVYDDHHRLTERARRLLKRAAHAEFPRSKVRHLISNVEVAGEAAGLVRVNCNYVVFRSRNGMSEMFPGHAVYDLRVGDDSSIAIRRKRVMVDSDTLHDQGRISIIL